MQRKGNMTEKAMIFILTTMHGKSKNDYCILREKLLVMFIVAT